MKKRYIIIIIVSVAVFCLIIGNLVYKKAFKEQNVFDYMYNTRVHGYIDFWNPGKFRGDFTNMQQLKNISRHYESNSAPFYENYKPEYLSKGTELQITFYAKPQKEVAIVYNTNLNETDSDKRYDGYKWYEYIYNVNEKTLTYSTNDSENTHKNFLYDIFLKDWFEANPDMQFSLDNLGEFTLLIKENKAVAD